MVSQSYRSFSIYLLWGLGGGIELAGTLHMLVANLPS